MSEGDDGKRHLPTIPVRWKGGGHVIEDEALVVPPNAEEQALYGSDEQRPRQTCATCVKFDRQAGQDQMQRERFVAKLIAEYQWKKHHLGAGVETFGLCKETSDRITSMHSAACEHHRPRRGRVRGLFSGM